MFNIPHPNFDYQKVINKLPLPQGEGVVARPQVSEKMGEGWLICLLCLLFLFLFAHSSFAFSFVVFGDNQDGDSIFQKIINKVNQEKGVAFAVNTGDLVQNGTESEYLHYKELISQLKMPVHNAMGNHDAVSGGWKIFKKMFGPDYYSFDYEGAHFVILDNSFKASFDSQQFEWLKKDLAATDARQKFVFMHRPTFDPSELYKNYIMSGREIAQQLMQLFIKYKVDYVFAGHIHGYARSERDGVIYLISGGAGAPLYLPPGFGGFHNYIKVEVNNDKISDKVVRIDE